MRFLSFTLTVLLVLSLSACSGKSEKEKGTTGSGAAAPEALTKETLALMNEKADVLESVKDKETAEKAKPKLEEINKKKTDLKERQTKAMQETGLEKFMGEMAKLEEKHKDEFSKARERLMNAREKALKNKDVAAILKGIDLR